MPIKARALFILIAIAAIPLVLAAGCSGPTPWASNASTMADLDAALASRPVFVEFGSPRCTWCEKEKLVIENISKVYDGIAFLYVNADAASGLADAFYVSAIPQMNLIVKKNADNTYLYIGPDGRTTADRRRSQIIGYRTGEQLMPLLDAAIAARQAS